MMILMKIESVLMALSLTSVNVPLFFSNCVVCWVRKQGNSSQLHALTAVIRGFWQVLGVARQNISYCKIGIVV
ncbi:hypothetical protein [Comamonas sp.]